MNPIRHLAALILLSQGVQQIARYFNKGYLAAIAIKVAKAIAERASSFEEAEQVVAVFALENGGKLNEFTDSTIDFYVDEAFKKADSEQYAQWYEEIDKLIRSDADVAEDDSHIPDDDEVKDDAKIDDVKSDDIKVDDVKTDEVKVDEVKTDENKKPDEPQADIALTDLTIPATVKKVLEAAGLTTASLIKAYDDNPEHLGGLASLPNFDEVRRKRTLDAIERASSKE